MGKYNTTTVFEFSTLKVGNLNRFSSDEMKTPQQTINLVLIFSTTKHYYINNYKTEAAAMTESSKRWVTVTTSEGMFSSECAVSLTLANGKQVSFFADHSLLQRDEGRERLQVTLVSTDDAHRRDVVLLPVETFETGSRWVEVPAGQEA